MRQAGRAGALLQGAAAAATRLNCLAAAAASRLPPLSLAPRLCPSPAQLLSAVAYLHDRWVMHRDLKLSNLCVLWGCGVLLRCRGATGLPGCGPSAAGEACEPPPDRVWAAAGLEAPPRPPPRRLFTHGGQLKLCDYG